MSRNIHDHSNQDRNLSLSSTTTKDIVCNDCGGISTTKVQHLLLTLEGATQVFNTLSSSSSNSIIEKQTKLNESRGQRQRKSNELCKKKVARKHSQKTSFKRNPIKKKFSSKSKQIKHFK